MKLSILPTYASNPISNAPLLIVHGAQGQAKKNLEAECAAHTNIECIQVSNSNNKCIYHGLVGKFHYLL